MSKHVQVDDTIADAAGIMSGTPLVPIISASAAKAAMGLSTAAADIATLQSHVPVSGSGTLSGGTVTISNATVTTSSVIMVEGTSSGSTSVGSLRISAQSTGSFTVSSNNILDTTPFKYLIFN